MHLLTLRAFGINRGLCRKRVPFKGLFAAGLGLLASVVCAQPADLDIGVRSSVTEGTPKWNKEKTEAEGGHGMIYGILAAKQVESVDRLVRPVDEKKVVSLLMDTLDENGFREFLPGETPAILITASYGRGELANPYIRGLGEVGGGASLPSPMTRPSQAMDSQAADAAPAAAQGGVTMDSAPLTQTIIGANPQQLFDEKTPGYEAKLQKAAFEKLFIRVTAWEYPPTPTSKPKMLWKTIMVVDDPDHRDLNNVAAAMFAAGGPWFDKLHRKPEVEVRKPLPDGHVKVGTPEVREPFKVPKGK